MQGTSSKHASYSATHAVFDAHLMHPPPKLPHAAVVAQSAGEPLPAPPLPPLVLAGPVPVAPPPICAEVPEVPADVDPLPPDPGGGDGLASAPHAVPTAPAAIIKKSKSSSLIVGR